MIIYYDKYIIDSNLLIDYFSEAKHCAEVKKIINQGVYINDFILCEVLNFLQNKYSPHHSIEAQNMIFNEKENFYILSSDNNTYSRAISIREKYADNKFSFTDSIILTQAEYHGLKVYTTDRRMKNYKEAEVINPLDK